MRIDIEGHRMIITFLVTNGGLLEYKHVGACISKWFLGNKCLWDLGDDTTSTLVINSAEGNKNEKFCPL